MPRRKRTQTYEECSPEIQERILKATACHSLVDPCTTEDVTKMFFEDPHVFKVMEKRVATWEQKFNEAPVEDQEYIKLVQKYLGDSHTYRAHHIFESDKKQFFDYLDGLFERLSGEMQEQVRNVGEVLTGKYAALAAYHLDMAKFMVCKNRYDATIQREERECWQGLYNTRSYAEKKLILMVSKQVDNTAEATKLFFTDTNRFNTLLRIEIAEHGFRMDS